MGMANKMKKECKICDKSFEIGTKSWGAIDKIGKCMNCHRSKRKKLK